MLKFGSKSDVTVLYRATIRLLDDSEIIHCDFQPQHKGNYILEYVCKQLNILEIDYFGLRYVDSSRQRHWLDLSKTAIKQVKDMETILFSFRVKYYPPDPLRLKEEITRYQIYLQLKRDLLHGRLYCSPGEAALLAACIIQSELGDYDPEVHEGNYIAEHKLLLKQTPAIEERALELHQTQLKGFSPEQAELQFLKLAAQLDTYAVDPHPVKDHKGTTLYLGINHCGILTFQGSRKTNHFRWPEVQKINYEGKMFIVHLTITEDMRTKKKHTVGFKCPTGSNCRHVWKCAIEQMVFFTLTRASDAPVMSGGSIFSWGTKFKYTGRTEREVLEESGPLRKEEPPIQRCSSAALRRKASSVPATPSTPSQDLVEIRYSSLPRSCHSAGLDGAGMSDIGSGMPLSSPYCPDNTLPLLETVSEDQEIHARRNNALDETNTHASANTTTTTCYTTTSTSNITTTFTTATTTPTPTTTTTTTSRSIATISNSITSSSSNSTTTATTTTTTIDNTVELNNQQVAKKLKKYHPKSTPQTRPQALYSQRIVIGSEELSGQDIDNVVRRKINALEKSPKVVRSTALIVKRSVAPANTRPTASSALPARIGSQHAQMAAMTTTKMMTISSVPNGDLRPSRDVVDAAAVSHEFDSGSDYYFRDSFEHSASESQLLEASGLSGKAGAYGSSRSIAPLPKLQRLQNSKICNVQQSLTSPSGAITSTAPSARHQHRQSLQQQAASAAAAAVTGAGEPVLSAPCSAAQQRLRGCQAQLVRLVVPALMLSFTVLLVVAVLVFETDSKLLEGLRKTPHMLALRDHYYRPIKNFLRSKLGLF